MHFDDQLNLKGKKSKVTSRNLEILATKFLLLNFML